MRFHYIPELTYSEWGIERQQEEENSARWLLGVEVYRELPGEGGSNPHM
jgi:hypothetical protein